MPASSVRPRSSRGIVMRIPCSRMTKKRSSAVKVARTLTAVPTLVPWSKAMRAFRWFEAKRQPTASMKRTPRPGVIFASMRVPDVSKVLGVALAAVSLTASFAVSACTYPDEGNLPLRRAVSRVKYLPEAEAWAAGERKEGVVVQYALSLAREWHRNGRCYWIVEARARGETWRRFYVSPDGKSVLSEDGRPVARAPRKATTSPPATAAPR